LGETYVDDLGLRQEGLTEFKTVADSLSNTGFGLQAMLRTAAMLENQGDSLAEEYYRRVLEADSASVYANFARSKLGLPLVNVVVKKPVVWNEATVVGPFLPASPSDTASAAPPDMSPLSETRETPPDSSVRRGPSISDSARAVTRTPEPTGIRFPQPQPIRREDSDTTSAEAGTDSTGSHAPADTTRPDEGRRP
jgi:hypothetical protein